MDPIYLSMWKTFFLINRKLHADLLLLGDATKYNILNPCRLMSDSGPFYTNDVRVGIIYASTTQFWAM